MTCSRYLPQQYRSFCGYIDDMELVLNSLKSQLSKIIDNKKYTKICIIIFSNKTDFINVRSSCLSACIIKSYIKKNIFKKRNCLRLVITVWGHLSQN